MEWSSGCGEVIGDIGDRLKGMACSSDTWVLGWLAFVSMSMSSGNSTMGIPSLFRKEFIMDK